MSTLVPNRRKGGGYVLPDDLNFEPTKMQIASAARRAQDPHPVYRPKYPIWFQYAVFLVVAFAFVGLIVLVSVTRS